MSSRTRNSLQNLRTRQYFDERAAVWDQYYAADGVMRNRIERFVGALAARSPHVGRLLDYGCGTGEIARACVTAGWQVTGCDVAPEMVENARRVQGGETVEWVTLETGRASSLPFPSASFDAVIASSVFEYLDDPAATLNELGRILAPGGWLLATVPDMRHSYRKVEKTRQRLVRILPLWLFVRLTPWRHMANYLRLSTNRFSVEEWRKILEAVNLHTETAPLGEDPLYLLAAKKR